MHGDRIKPTDRITLQIKDNEWQGVFIDFFFGGDVDDRSIFRVLVEKSQANTSLCVCIVWHCVCVCVCVCVCMHVCVHACVHACMCMYVCMCVSV